MLKTRYVSFIKMMYLHARTNKQGSDVKIQLDVSYEEWAAMSIEDQDQLVQEALGDLIESWVEDEEGE